jgi:hypothetical protein
MPRVRNYSQNEKKMRNKREKRRKRERKKGQRGNEEKKSEFLLSQEFALIFYLVQFKSYCLL